jgi:serine/threonine-protein kinase
MLVAIYNHLKSVPAGRRRFQRYFSLANIANDPTADEGTLRVYRAALSKVINSLSWESRMVIPRAIDQQQTVFAVDTGDLGWDRRNLWDEVLKQYPYGLTHKYDSNNIVKSYAVIVTKATGTDLPCVRADWFIATATRPPLYHKMLDLPVNVRDLEESLHVDIEKAFLNNALVRVGMLQSGVSKQPRMIERLPALFGAYWKSYDFKEENPLRDLTQFPLGPEFSGNPFPKRAFKQSGGEIIFNLPNGLQGYLLVDDKGKRIDKAPADIVEDKEDRVTGSGIIVNGLSCMSCHVNGMRRGIDILRTQSALTDANELAKLRRLHPEPQVMNLYWQKDEARFQKALVESRSLIRAEADGKLVEPITVVAKKYFGDVTLEQAARELGFDNPKSLQRVIPQSNRLKRLGLLPLADNTPIKRDIWEGKSRDFPVQSVFQDTARAFRLGTPVVSD